MQKIVKKFVTEHGLACGEKIRFMDLVSEVGELGKEIIKGTDYGKVAYTSTQNVKSEVGDCLFSLLALCCELDIDANEALTDSMLKYRKRFEDKADIGSGR